jgi:hypothetical protein
MMTLQEAKPIAERLRPEEGRVGTTTNAAFDIDTPMACESYVADAVSHLFSGFLIVEDLAAATRPVGGSQTPLDRSSKDIATVLVELNDCSVGFWLMPRGTVSRVARLRGFCAPSKRRRSTPEEGKPDAAAAGALEVKQPQGVEFHAGRLAKKRPEWANSLALATLHLVGAHRAMEQLSESSFPMGAPGSFELACHCLCAALATLDACLANYEG